MAEERVVYDDIKESVGKLRDIAKGLEATNKKIKDTLNLGGKWEGDASTHYTEQVTNFLNQGHYLDGAPETIASAALFLMQAAGAYEDAEESIKKDCLELLGGQDAIDKMDVNSLEDVDLNSRVSENFPIEEETTASPETNSSVQTTSNYTSGNTSSSIGGYTSSSGSYSSGGYSSNAGSYSSVIAAAPAVKSIKSGEKIVGLDKLDQDNQKNSPYTTDKYKSGSPEALVEELWKKQGSKYNGDIAIIKDENGDERYLVKLSSSYGEVGDTVDLTLTDESTLKCVIAESEPVANIESQASSVLAEETEVQSSTAESIYGTQTDEGKINVIEFKTNSEAQNIKYPFSENNKVTEVANKGNNVIKK